MSRGRKPELKAIDGGLKGLPKAPATLPDVMHDDWNIIGAEMVQRQILTASMTGLLEAYLIAIWTVRECQKAIEEHGILTKTAHGNLKPNPASGLMSKAQETVARMSAELGLTPSARSKKSFAPKEKQHGGAPDGLDV
ncbi:phage terminase small subunit P27 family [Agrobacterium rosae]|uniref:Phage terminase small subunit P27 family n=1 Tax=Agrobacterium rosae TaxID=1972867 RepID=A0AAW9F7Y1_9HYPH|nr:phage terminase small subunit P27 family [Agrobacterium rosae]MDX8301296.1 phage terminase small subunit P27 family [Agrobacterium rosae]